MLKCAVPTGGKSPRVEDIIWSREKVNKKIVEQNVDILTMYIWSNKRSIENVNSKFNASYNQPALCTALTERVFMSVSSLCYKGDVGKIQYLSQLQDPDPSRDWTFNLIQIKQLIFCHW